MFIFFPNLSTLPELEIQFLEFTLNNVISPIWASTGPSVKWVQCVNTSLRETGLCKRGKYGFFIGQTPYSQALYYNKQGAGMGKAG